MDTKKIQRFFESRSGLSKSAVAKEAGISRQYLLLILRGDRPLTEATAKKLEPVLIKYGLQNRKQIEDLGGPKTGKYTPPTDGARGHGLQHAHTAIAELKKIHRKDGLLQDAYDTVVGWIEFNR